MILAFGSTGTAAQTPVPKATRAQLQQSLRQDLAAYLKERGKAEHLSALSLTVSLGKNAAPISTAAGSTRYPSGPAATPNDLYQIGSNTKAFTAVAILQLEAQGRLSIDAPIGAYLPQYPAYGKLTLRRLLSMTSGLESYDNTTQWFQGFTKRPMANVSADTLIRFVYPAQKFPPGTRYYYSNTGYLLAQEIVDARSESRSFEREIARIIRSANLSNTFYSSHLYPAPIARRMIAGYYDNDDPGFGPYRGADMSRFSLSWAQGAGAIISTPQDLAAWVRVLYGSTTLLPAKQKQELLSLYSTKSGQPLARLSAADPAGFGLGVAQRFFPNIGTAWFYQGETLGFRAVHLYFPKSDMVVTLFANSRPIEAHSKLQALFGTLEATIKAAGY